MLMKNKGKVLYQIDFKKFGNAKKIFVLKLAHDVFKIVAYSHAMHVMLLTGEWKSNF